MLFFIAYVENFSYVCRMKVIIAGGRDFNDYDLLKKKCDKILSEIKEDIIIVSGGAKGADSLGERYANERGFGIDYFIPDWNKYGRAAGMLRNAEMSKHADAAIIFWDQKSRGSKNMIELSKKEGLKLRVINY